MRDERFRDFRRLCISLWAKMLMKKCFIWLLLSAAAVSCGLEEVSRRPQGGAGNVWVRPGANVDSVSKDETIIYVAAMEYHEWYDWRRDVAKGSVTCSLVVYSNGVPMLKVPVGDEYEVSSDPDTHRILNGHLYTDYSSDDETVIKKDGNEIMRYSGREMLADLIEHGDDVYTLGHDRNGDGFSFRKNGEVVLERDRGCTFGRLHDDGGAVGFAFYESISSTGSEIWRYYYVHDGVISQVAVREDIVKVWDVVPYKGEPAYLATVVGVYSPVLFTPDGMQALVFTNNTVMLTGRIEAKGETIYVEGLFERDGNRIYNGLWDSGGAIHVFPAGQTLSSISIVGDETCCVLNSTTSNTGYIYKCGQAFYMPKGYVAFGTQPSAVAGGILHVGISSLNGAEPLLWRDGQTTPLKINGFITAVSTNMN